MPTGEYPRGCDSAKVIFAIETKTARGSGTSPEDPARIVTEYWSLDGKKLAEHDPAIHESVSGEVRPLNFDNSGVLII